MYQVNAQRHSQLYMYTLGEHISIETLDINNIASPSTTLVRTGDQQWTSS